MEFFFQIYIYIYIYVCVCVCVCVYVCVFDILSKLSRHAELLMSLSKSQTNYPPTYTRWKWEDDSWPFRELTAVNVKLKTPAEHLDVRRRKFTSSKFWGRSKGALNPAGNHVRTRKNSKYISALPFLPWNVADFCQDDVVFLVSICLFFPGVYLVVNKPLSSLTEFSRSSTC